MIFEKQNVAEAMVIFEVENPVSIGPKYLFNRSLRHRREGCLVVGSFDNYLVGAHAVHAIEEALALAIQIAFYPQRRKFIGDHSERPPRGILCPAVPAIGENFRRSLPLIPRAEGDRKAVPLITTLSRIKSTGRRARSVEIITQRPVIGSRRSSGKHSSSMRRPYSQAPASNQTEHSTM